jgi:hypothetical protein
MSLEEAWQGRWSPQRSSRFRYSVARKKYKFDFFYEILPSCVVLFSSLMSLLVDVFVILLIIFCGILRSDFVYGVVCISVSI